MNRAATHEEHLLGLAEPVRLGAAIGSKIDHVDVEKPGIDGLACDDRPGERATIVRQLDRFGAGGNVADIGGTGLKARIVRADRSHCCVRVFAVRRRVDHHYLHRFVADDLEAMEDAGRIEAPVPCAQDALLSR